MSSLGQHFLPYEPYRGSIPTWDNFDASIDIMKPQDMVESWEDLSGKTFSCAVQNGCNFANLGGLHYPLPEGMRQGDLLEVSVSGPYGSAPYYECSVTFQGKQRQNIQLLKQGKCPTARLSFRRW